MTWLGALLAFLGGFVAALLGWFRLPYDMVPLVRYALVAAFFVVPAATSLYNEHRGATAREFELRKLRKAYEQKNRDLASSVIEQLLGQMCSVLDSGGTIPRANVMLVDRNELAIRYHHRMVAAPDIDLRFQKYQGCAGHAWGTGKMTICDLQGIGDTDLTQTWKLNPTQRAVTANLKCIVSAPIRSLDHPDIIVGVLSFDSQAALGQTRFDEGDVQSKVFQTAEMVAKLLKMGNIITGGEE